MHRAKIQRRGRNHVRDLLRRNCTPLVIVTTSASLLIFLFFATGLSRSEPAGDQAHTAQQQEQPKHRFLEGHGLLSQSDPEEPEKYFATKSATQGLLAEGGETPQSKPKLGFYFRKDIPEQLLKGSSAPEGLLPQLQKVAKHKAAEGKGGKMGFYFSHDIPEEIKADGAQSDDSAAAALKASGFQRGQSSSKLGSQQTLSSGKSLKQQGSTAERIVPQQQGLNQRLAQGSNEQLAPARTPIPGRPPGLFQQQSNVIVDASSHVDGTEQVRQFGQQAGSSLSTLASDSADGSHVQSSQSDVGTSSRRDTQNAQSTGSQQVQQPLGKGSGSALGGLEAGQQLASSKRAPLGYYFSVPEGVKAANSQLFREPHTPSGGAASGPSSKGPLGYYFSKDINDDARRRGNWRARLLRSHLQPH